MSEDYDPKPMVFKFRCRSGGGHMHVNVYAAPAPDQTFALLGTLMMRGGEWQLFGAALSMGMKQTHGQATMVVEGEREALDLLEEER